ncbi:hypothetical protein NE237_022985 [Protea cynaroides]|uniref:Uncharacterized protein n=1 Tax=Protea cynaroides TaxID=273540 RepID=A0A9Q0K4Q1_9MAGN|nr:hypothetical protein NE237_022985 [Protea cynaroides]
MLLSLTELSNPSGDPIFSSFSTPLLSSVANTLHMASFAVSYCWLSKRSKLSYSFFAPVASSIGGESQKQLAREEARYGSHLLLISRAVFFGREEDTKMGTYQAEVQSKDTQELLGYTLLTLLPFSL